MSRPVLTEDNAAAHRRAVAQDRLQRYDYAAAALVPFLVAMADRVRLGVATAEDVDRIILEATTFQRILPGDVPAYPVETP